LKTKGERRRRAETQWKLLPPLRPRALAAAELRGTPPRCLAAAATGWPREQREQQQQGRSGTDDLLPIEQQWHRREGLDEKRTWEGTGSARRSKQERTVRIGGRG
jgi:hypothetical protein